MTSDGQQTTESGEDQKQQESQPWWKRLRPFPSAWTRQPFMPSLYSKRRWRKRKSTRPTIRHPHFSGRGATVTTTATSSATSSPPLWTTYSHPRPVHHDGRPLTLIPRHLSLGGDQPGADEFPEGISLSSLSGDSLTSVSSETNDTHVHCSSSCGRTSELDTEHGWTETPAAADCSTEENGMGIYCEIRETGQERRQPEPAADYRSVPLRAPSTASLKEQIHQTNDKDKIHQPQDNDGTSQCDKEDIQLDKEKPRLPDDEHAYQSDTQRADDKSREQCQQDFNEDPRRPLYEEHSDAESNKEHTQHYEKLSICPNTNDGDLTSRGQSDQGPSSYLPNLDNSHALNHAVSEVAYPNSTSPNNKDYAVGGGHDRNTSDGDTDISVLPLDHKDSHEVTSSKEVVTVSSRLLTSPNLNPENLDHMGVVTVDGCSDDKVQRAGCNNARTPHSRNIHELTRREETATAAGCVSDGTSLRHVSSDNNDCTSMETMGEPTVGESTMGEPNVNEPKVSESTVDARADVSMKTVSDCSPVAGTVGGRGDDVMHEADQAVTVTDGESVYHILQRLDQELDAHELSDSLDEDSVDGSWSPDVHHRFAAMPNAPSRPGGEDPAILAVSYQSLHDSGFSERNLYGDSCQQGSSHGDRHPADPCFHHNGFCSKCFEQGGTQADPHHCRVPAHQHLNDSFHRFSNNSLSKAYQNQQEATEENSSSTEAERSLKVRQFPSWKKPSLFRSQHYWTSCRAKARPAGLDKGIDVSEHSSLDTDQSSSDRSSPTVNKLFNAESDSYDVNPLPSPFPWGSSSATLYSPDRPSTVSKAYRHPVSVRQLFASHTVTEKPFTRRHSTSLVQLFIADKNTAEKTFVQRRSGSRAADIDTSELKVLEELVSTLDSLRPGSYSDTDRRPVPSTFYTLQRKSAPVRTLWRHSLGTNAAGKAETKFYTLQREPSCSLDRGKTFGTIRSLDSLRLARTRRNEMSNKGADWFTRLAHVIRPGSPGAHPENEWARRSISAGNNVGTPRQKKRSKRKVLTMPRKGLMGLFRRRSSSSLASSSDGHHERRELSEIGVNPGGRVTVPSGKEDVVFGQNNVGYETANLY